MSAGGDPAASAWLAESARMLERDGRYADALDAWARVTDAAPDDPAGWRERGRLLQILSRLEPSRECLETAVRLDPNDLDARLYLARTRQRLGDGDGALAEYEAAMRVAPGDMRARCGVAFALERRHDLTRAASILDDGLAAEPGHPLATLIRARVDRRQGDAAGARDRLTALLATDPDDEIRSRAAYELARCLEKLGDHPGAFEAATIGNETQARTPVARAIRSDDALAFIEDQKVFSRDHFRRWASHPVPDDGPPPIFLVGFPRSGTTMTEQILGAHPALAVSNEQDLFRPALSRLIEGLPTDLSAEAAMEAATPERIAEARLHYRASAARVIAAQPGAERLVDKYPPNLGMLAYVQRVFPDARVVVALRDPRDVCLSCYVQEFVVNPTSVHFHTLEGAARLYEASMGLWLRQRELLELAVLETRYEDVVSDLEGESRRMMDFLGLAWSEELLRFHEKPANARAVTTPSYEAVSEPVHGRARGKWRNHAGRLAPILPRLDPFVEALGYQPAGDA